MRLSAPQGVVGAFAWALKDSVSWRGQIRGRTEHIEVLLQMWRASHGGADPMLFIPETGLVMFGRIAELLEPRAVTDTISDLPMTFEESPLLLAEEAA